MTNETHDAALVATLPGFTNASATVNGVTLHYVAGGSGAPVLLLPSWPQTWWEFHEVMPVLAQSHRVIAVDYRGMGASDKPAAGYDKKTMAADLAALVAELELGAVDVVGSDVGSMLAYSFAANHPELTRSVTLLDAPHPFAVFQQIPVLPAPGTYDLQNPQRGLHPWWFAFNQITGMPEQVFAGRYSIVQDWLFDYLSVRPSAITPFDREVYAGAYDSAEAIRASNAWFQAFATDIDDLAGYAPLTMPVLAVGGFSYDFVAAFVASAAPAARLVRLGDTGHFIPAEQPEQLLALLADVLV